MTPLRRRVDIMKSYSFLLIALASSGCFSEPPAHGTSVGSLTTGDAKLPAGDEDDSEGGSTGGPSSENEDDSEGGSTGEGESESGSTGEDESESGSTGGDDSTGPGKECSQTCWLPSSQVDHTFEFPYLPDTIVEHCASDIVGLDTAELGSLLNGTGFYLGMVCIPETVSDAYEACGDDPSLVYHFAATLKSRCEEILESYGCGPDNNEHGLGYEALCETYMVDPYLEEYEVLTPDLHIVGYEEAGSCESPVDDPSC